MQLYIILGLGVYFFFLIMQLRKNNLELKYSLLWMFTGLVMLVFAVFPGLLVLVSDILQFRAASNALFVILIGLGMLIMMALTAIISRHKQRIKVLTQTAALLDKRVREAEKHIKLLTTIDGE